MRQEEEMQMKATLSAIDYPGDIAMLSHTNHVPGKCGGGNKSAVIQANSFIALLNISSLFPKLF